MRLRGLANFSQMKGRIEVITAGECSSSQTAGAVNGLQVVKLNDFRAAVRRTFIWRLLVGGRTVRELAHNAMTGQRMFLEGDVFERK